ncbi:MAG: [FeFe] hydrogenase H-cluster maturation GTPase HydF [Coriobacteriia bacterium]|nr:[FeFe] hydrogenase H-cluster maturation GTPase HydF [Coriobacteriia bacterium]
MSLNETPSGERVRIGFFGLRNAGKSSLVNAVCNQEVALVSDVAGTTTDPVMKAMEILPLGPVSIVDTPGIDDTGELGEQRVRRTRDALRNCDMAVLVSDASRGLAKAERELVDIFAKQEVPCILALNKADLLEEGAACELSCDDEEAEAKAEDGDLARILVSAKTGQGIAELKELMAKIGLTVEPEKLLIRDLLEPGDVVVLVTPIDSSAPKGRMILPQQMVLRDVLDAHATALVCQPEELAQTLDALPRVRLVVTDSQAFEFVSKVTPENIELTSFSILMARYKGELDLLVRGAAAIGALTDESRVLISEGCTHHRQCEDIGTVKLPAWIRERTGANPSFDFTSGRAFPDDVSSYDLVIHCGACMLNAKEMHWRMGVAQSCGVPMVNYGVAIAFMKGILSRSLRPLGL